MTGADGRLSALWLDTLQRLADRTAHEIRNALNGAAVNLEVVRSRMARGGQGEAVTPYAASAAAELERVTAQTAALVALARSPGARADVASLLSRFTALLASKDARATLALELPSEPGSPPETPAADAARLAIGAALLGAMEREGSVSCRLGTDGVATVYIECEAGGPLSLADEVETAVEAEGITLLPTRNGIAISFPPVRTG
jgi:hypothetical protein